MSCFVMEQLNHLQVVLVTIPVCLLFLSILEASGPYLTISRLIIICIYLILRCLLSDIFGSLISMVIMLSSLISRMLTYIFLLLSIMIVYLQFVWHNMPYQLNVLPFGLTTAPRLGFSQPSLNLSCSLAIARIFKLLSIWMTSWSWFALSRQVRGLTHFCVPYCFTLNCI